MTTARFGFTEPADTDLVKDGAANMRALMDILEASGARIDHGTAAARPAAAIADRFYRATDTSDISLDTGTGWISLAQQASYAFKTTFGSGISRSFGTVYQPSTTRATFVTAQFSTGSAVSIMTALIGATSSPTSEVGRVDHMPSGLVATVAFMVPPGWYYELINFQGAGNSLALVTEVTL